MAELVCFGEALIDFLGEPETHAGPQRFQRHAGGAPANVAVAAARLGTATAFVGMFGKDTFGGFLLKSLKAAGVDTGYALRTNEANTALAFVTLDDTGERRFSFYRPPAADLLFRPEHFKAECFAKTRFFHVCSNSLTEADIAATTLDGVRRAQEAGALVSFDINLRPKLWSPKEDPAPRIWSVLKEADVVKASAAELRFLIQGLGSEQAVLDELWRGRARWLLVTDGSAPARQFTRRGEDILPIFPVRAVNTTGAGDAFMGGLLSRLVSEKVDAANLDGFLADAARVQKSLRFASACGALSVQRHGAFEAMPTLPEVEAFLKRQS